jgi:hypothetical protein
MQPDVIAEVGLGQLEQNSLTGWRGLMTGKLLHVTRLHFAYVLINLTAAYQLQRLLSFDRVSRFYIYQIYFLFRVSEVWMQD